LFGSVLVALLFLVPFLPPLFSLFGETPLPSVGSVKLSAAPGVLPEAEEAALSELRHLAAALPGIFAKRLHIRLAGPCRHERDGSLVTGFSFPSRGKAVILAPRGGMLGPVFFPDPSSGRTLTLRPAESAVPCYVAATVAHEVGHLVRFRFLSREEFQQYLQLRGWRPDLDPEELFAEDFRWLFGSETGKQIAFQPGGIAPPGEKERRMILRAIQTSGAERF